jgi:hypothetical protein
MRPFTYTAKYNSTLKESLNYIEGISLMPKLETGFLGVAIAYTIAFK